MTAVVAATAGAGASHPLSVVSGTAGGGAMTSLATRPRAYLYLSTPSIRVSFPTSPALDCPTLSHYSKRGQKECFSSWPCAGTMSVVRGVTKPFATQQRSRFVRDASHPDWVHGSAVPSDPRQRQEATATAVDT